MLARMMLVGLPSRRVASCSAPRHPELANCICSRRRKASQPASPTGRSAPASGTCTQAHDARTTSQLAFHTPCRAGLRCSQLRVCRIHVLQPGRGRSVRAIPAGRRAAVCAAADRLRSLRIFRDQTGLTMTPGLWPDIESVEHVRHLHPSRLSGISDLSLGHPGGPTLEDAGPRPPFARVDRWHYRLGHADE